MNAENSYSSSLNSGHCLSTVALRQYIDGTLPKTRIHTVEKHLLDCDFCSSVLEDMDVSEEGRTTVESIVENVNNRILKMVGPLPRPSLWTAYRNYFLVGGGALILFSGIALYPYHSGSAVSNSSPVTPAANPAISDKKETKEVQKPVQDEFPIHHTDASSSVEKTVTTTSGGLPSPGLDPPPTLQPDPASIPVPAANPAPVNASPAKKEEAKAESESEKINYADLQIVSAKVLSQITKTSGSSRKESRNGQIAAPRDNGASFLPEDMPSYPGGNEAMEEYLASNFKNPVKDKRTLSGKAVGVMFTVSSKGRISDVEITHSIAPELDVEIIRLISSMPTWNPAKHKGDITCVLAVTVN
jgi:hypothetical protein